MCFEVLQQSGWSVFTDRFSWYDGFFFPDTMKSFDFLQICGFLREQWDSKRDDLTDKNALLQIKLNDSMQVNSS